MALKAKDLDRLPERDLIAELRVYQTKLTGNEATYGLAAGDTTAITNAIDAFETGCDTLDTKRAETAAARGDRDSLRDALTDLAKSQMRTARNEVGNDSPALGEINLAPYDTTQTPAGEPSGVPFALLDFGILRHTINFRDAGTPDKRGKPAGVLGCEIWSKVGGSAPVTEGDYSMVGLGTQSPFIVNYTMAEAGKTVWYRMRWLSTSGEKGGWSETVDATING
jgi:hypothetical protein